MRCKCKVLSVSGQPASDGSIVPIDVMESYLRSEECINALRTRKMLGSLTHRTRDISTTTNYNPASLSKTIGKDDLMLTINEAAPTHFVEDLYIEDGWLWADIKILEEDGLDDHAIQNIRRLRGLLKQGIHPGVSAIIVGYWKDSLGGGDVLKKLVNFKGIDVTLNPSWKQAEVSEIYDDEKPTERRPVHYSGVRAKAFSDLDSLGLGGTARSSKIDGGFTKLKAKVFSASGSVTELPEYETREKIYSITTVKERVRFAKMGPRMRFRRLIIDYRQTIRSMGGTEKIDPDTLKVMKSLFTTDVLDIMKSITPEIIVGKQINTLIGASALGKNIRTAAQKLQMPFRYAMNEVNRQGFVSKVRYQKIQAAYMDFTNALVEDIFGPNSTLPEDIDTDEGDLED